MARRLPNMTSKTQTMNVLDMLPTAYWVNGEVSGTGAADSAAYKQTTKMAWDKKKLYAEEIAVIVPIPEAVLDDLITTSGVKSVRVWSRRSARRLTPQSCLARTSRPRGVMALSRLRLQQATAFRPLPTLSATSWARTA